MYTVEDDVSCLQFPHSDGARSVLMQEDQDGATGDEELSRLREELAGKNEELAEMKSRLESVRDADLDADLD